MAEEKGNRPVYIKAYEPWSDLVFTDPIAIPLTPILARLKVHPNAITIVSLLAGLVAGIAFGMGNWLWGAVIFQFSYLCDCLDGKVARLRQMTSEFGAKLDVWADGVRKPSSFLGIGIYFYLQGQMVFTFLTGLFLVIHLLLHKLYKFAGVQEYDLEFPEFQKNVIRRFAPRALNLYTFFEEQVIEFVIFPLAGILVGLPGGAVWFFYGGITVAVLGLLKLIIVWRHSRMGRYEDIHQDWAGTKGSLKK